MAKSKYEKRMEAEERQAQWDKLSTQQKIDSLKHRRGKSKKQLARLRTMLRREQKGA